MSKGATSPPPLEPPSANSLMAMGSLEFYLEAAGDLAEADALVEIEAFEAAERKPPVVDVNTRAGVGVWLIEVRATTWKTSRVTFATDLEALKGSNMAFILSLDR